MYREPKYRVGAFTCPHCGVLTGQSWSDELWLTGEKVPLRMAYAWGYCQSTDCGKPTAWLSGSFSPKGFNQSQVVAALRSGGSPMALVWPKTKGGPQPAGDMLDDVARYYEEARAVLADSPAQLVH